MRPIDEEEASKLVDKTKKRIWGSGKELAKDLVKATLAGILLGAALVAGWKANDLYRGMEAATKQWRPEIAVLYDVNEPCAEIILDPGKSMYPLAEKKGWKFSSGRVFARRGIDPNDSDYERIKKEIKYYEELRNESPYYNPRK